MTFLSDESSIEGSQPLEGIELILPAVTYRLATGTRDVSIGGFTYTAYPSNRGEVRIGSSDNGADLIISVPLAHPVPQRYLAIGVPPRRISVIVHRKQTGGDSEVIWRGDVTSMGVEGQVALLRVPARVVEILQRRLPTISVGRSCPHVLYDANCKVVRPPHTESRTLIDVNGRIVKVDFLPVPDQWARFGEILHQISGERMTIQDQVGTTITMQLPIYGASVGDAVQIFAGCDHTIAYCDSNFLNRANFGGAPQLNSVDPIKAPAGYGIYVSEP